MTDQEADTLIEAMKVNKKGVKKKFIFEAVAFNTECPRQMALLKIAIMNSSSFSGLVKELIATNFDKPQVKEIVRSNEAVPEKVVEVQPSNSWF